MATQRKPSQVLHSLASGIPSDVFVALLVKELYPALDSLPRAPRSNIVSILEAIQHNRKKTTRAVVIPDYDEMEEILQTKFEALREHIAQDYFDGYEEQGEIMDGIVNKIAKWLQGLWTVGVENRDEIMLVYECLPLFSQTINRLENCENRAEFSDDRSIKIKDASGRKVYAEKYGGISQAILWLWRELLVVAVIDSTDCDQEDLECMIACIKGQGILDDVRDLLREEDETEPEGADSFNDQHWSNEMRTAAERLKEILDSV